MNFSPKFLLLLISLYSSSCQQEKKEPPKEKWETRYERQSQLDSLNSVEAVKIASSYDAIVGWDTTGMYTYSLQEILNSSTRPISFIGKIMDIVKVDSVYILKLVETKFRISKRFIAEISVDPSVFNELKDKLNPNSKNKGCFIFQVTNVSSHLPMLKSDVESGYDNAEEASTYITFDFDESLIKLKGKLVSYFIYERVKEKDE